MDPTWTETCRCGAKVSVNQMGQHHHTDCGYQRNGGLAANCWSSPSCCDDPDVERIWYNSKDAGTRCSNCDETWEADALEPKIRGLANYITPDYTFAFPAARGEGFRSIVRAIDTAIEEEDVEC